MTEPRDGPRAIRVFVSSTFRDMQAEREELVKRVFPQLRKLCESRGVTWGEVDLRWGVTDEQKAEGQVLPICLAEIALCRPYFIGLLGERYGWVPGEVPPSLVEQEEWLSGAAGRSVTELEILHGVLNNPDMAEHAFFYFRDPKYIDLLPPGTRHEFVDGPELAGRLQDLKQRIRGSRFPVRESYPDPRSLGELVLEDMRRVVDRLYPAEDVPDALGREAAGHEAFIASRARVYQGRQDYFRTLDAHASPHTPNLAVLGASGAGKSALLANWVRRYRERHPSDIVIPHFIGASAAGTNPAAIQRRLIGELNRRVGLEVEMPDSPDALHAAFANALNMAAARRVVTIVIDALDQLEDVGNALDLGWLPARIPDNIRLICSTLPGRSLDQLKARGFAMLDVEPLRIDERIDLIEAYLAQYRKALSVERAQRIASAAPAGNPLFLRAMLEELRVWGDHLTIDAQIEHCLSSATIEELYQKILGRWERDFERERPGLVGDAVSLIWAARRGLSEAELLDLLGDGDALPQAIWSPLFLAAESSLVLRSGLINFFHQYLRDAVRNRYLASEERQHQAHRRLAEYFRPRETNPRKVEELPWQLARTHAWQRLYDLLADVPFFTYAWDTNQDDVKTYWAQIERETSLQRLEAYRGMIENPADQNTRQLFAVAHMLENSGHLREALGLLAALAAHYRRTENAVALERTLNLQARTLYFRGELDAALALYEEQESLCRAGGRRHDLSGALSGRAGILMHRGKLREALALHEEAEAVCREAGDKDGVQISLGNQAGVLLRLGEVDKASERIDQKELLCRELGSKSGLAECLRSRGGVLVFRKELDRAIEVLEEDERICRELGDKEGLHTTLGLQALVHKKRKDHDRAIACFREKQRLCREMGNMSSLATALANEAAVLIHSSPADALARAEEASQIAEARGLTLLVDRLRPILERARAAADKP